MTGCSKSIALSKPVIPANLLQPCPTLNRLEQDTGKEVLLWAVDTVAKYNECDVRLDALVEAIE
ncbi:Rz1-like lysis system protein LysC [Acinetobacter venetianus]|uniref:Rz1-like lysis system protein LysC n=1 Tax=Acinetobacter venetianus TaxID=52133 RepID=UPI0009C17829|nr:hypothetical protein [Acinetobacter venetianus]